MCLDFCIGFQMKLTLQRKIHHNIYSQHAKYFNTF